MEDAVRQMYYKQSLPLCVWSFYGCCGRYRGYGRSGDFYRSRMAAAQTEVPGEHPVRFRSVIHSHTRRADINPEDFWTSKRFDTSQRAGERCLISAGLQRLQIHFGALQIREESLLRLE